MHSKVVVSVAHQQPVAKKLIDALGARPKYITPQARTYLALLGEGGIPTPYQDRQKINKVTFSPRPFFFLRFINQSPTHHPQSRSDCPDQVSAYAERQDSCAGRQVRKVYRKFVLYLLSLARLSLQPPGDATLKPCTLFLPLSPPNPAQETPMGQRRIGAESAIGTIGHLPLDGSP